MINKIKKLIIIALVLWGVFVFYKKFAAPVLEPFFRDLGGKVDFFGISSTSADKAKLPK